MNFNFFITFIHFSHHEHIVIIFVNHLSVIGKIFIVLIQIFFKWIQIKFLLFDRDNMLIWICQKHIHDTFECVCDSLFFIVLIWIISVFMVVELIKSLLVIHKEFFPNLIFTVIGKPVFTNLAILNQLLFAWIWGCCNLLFHHFH